MDKLGMITIGMVFICTVVYPVDCMRKGSYANSYMFFTPRV
jgi:hypothetical protein